MGVLSVEHRQVLANVAFGFTYLRRGTEAELREYPENYKQSARLIMTHEHHSFAATT